MLSASLWAGTMTRTLPADVSALVLMRLCSRWLNWFVFSSQRARRATGQRSFGLGPAGLALASAAVAWHPLPSIVTSADI